METSLTIENCPAVNENFFQSTDFIRVLSKIGWDIIRVDCKKSGSQPALYAYSPRSVPIYTLLFPRYFLFYGPTIGKKFEIEYLDELLNGLCDVLSRNACTILEVRTPFPYHVGHEVFVKNGFHRKIIGGEYSAIIDLEKNSTELWRDMRKNTRSCIKKSQKNGVEVKPIESEIELKSFFSVYLDTSIRRGFTPYPYSLFKTLWSELEKKKKVKVFIATWNHKVIAGIVNTFHKRESVPYLLGSSKKYWKFSSNHLLMWHSMNWSKDVAASSIFKLYHMPRKRNPDSEVDYYMFKSSFGGRIVEECAFYDRIISPVKYNIHKTLHKIAKGYVRNFFSNQARV